MGKKKGKVILKNTAKYNILKLAKGLDMAQYKFYSANYNVFNNYKYVSDWVYTGDGRVFFKSGESMFFDAVRNQRIVNELLYDNLAMQLGMWTARYEPATYEKTTTLISHDVKEDADFDEDVRTIGSYLDEPFKREISLEEILRKWEMVPGLRDYECDKKELIFDFYRMIVLDAITFQEDRHDENIHLYVDDEHKTVRFAPIIDNEYAFGAKTLNRFFDLSDFGKQNYEIDEEEFLAQHGAQMRLSMTPEIQVLPCTERYRKNVMEIVKFAVARPELKEFLIDALKCVDIDQAIDSVEKKGYVISDEYKQYLRDLVGMSKKVFAECIKEIKAAQQPHKKQGDGKE